MKEAAARTYEWSRRNRAAGLCNNCSTTVIADGAFCRKHWFISRGPTHGRRNKRKTFKSNYGKVSWGKYLEELWDQQSGCSALSGDKLTEGVNASLDRIDPNGDYVEGNVRWVTTLENSVRQNMTDSEMILMFKKILRFVDGKDQ